MIKKPEQVYGNAGRQLYYQWTQSEHRIYQEPVYDHTRDYIESLEAENAKLLEQGERLFDKTLELGTENAKLHDWCKELLGMAESKDPEWFHWPEVHEELRKLGVDA